MAHDFDFEKYKELPQNEFISEISDLLMIGSIQAASGVMDTLVQFFEENNVSRRLARSAAYLYLRNL